MTKVKKKKSFSAQIKALRKERNEWRLSSHRSYCRIRELDKEIKELHSMIPIKFYKVEFECKFQEITYPNSSNIVEAYTASSAIQKAKLTYKQGVELKLINITLLA